MAIVRSEGFYVNEKIPKNYLESNQLSALTTVLPRSPVLTCTEVYCNQILVYHVLTFILDGWLCKLRPLDL